MASLIGVPLNRENYGNCSESWTSTLFKDSPSSSRNLISGESFFFAVKHRFFSLSSLRRYIFFFFSGKSLADILENRLLLLWTVQKRHITHTQMWSNTLPYISKCCTNFGLYLVLYTICFYPICPQVVKWIGSEGKSISGKRNQRECKMWQRVPFWLRFQWETQNQQLHKKVFKQSQEKKSLHCQHLCCMKIPHVVFKPEDK